MQKLPSAAKPLFVFPSIRIRVPGLALWARLQFARASLLKPRRDPPS